jgi:hypothetical protein
LGRHQRPAWARRLQRAKFSDSRLKTDIKRVGTLDNGLPVYTFRYHGDPQVHMGLMAQDVEVTNPDAVELHESGFKMVHYDKASA